MTTTVKAGAPSLPGETILGRDLPGEFWAGYTAQQVREAKLQAWKLLHRHQVDRVHIDEYAHRILASNLAQVEGELEADLAEMRNRSRATQLRMLEAMLDDGPAPNAGGLSAEMKLLLAGGGLCALCIHRGPCKYTRAETPGEIASDGHVVYGPEPVTSCAYYTSERAE